jgi:hypothetical protein
VHIPNITPEGKSALEKHMKQVLAKKENLEKFSAAIIKAGNDQTNPKTTT